MNFSEYFNALYPYLSNGEKNIEFFDGMIGHFIHAEAQESCELLNCGRDTKRRYIKKKNPNKIKPSYAQYAYSKHNSDGYINWLNNRMYDSDSYERIEEWLEENDIEFDDCCVACDKLLADILFSIGHPNTVDTGNVKLPEKNITDENGSLNLSDNDKKLLKDFHIDFDSIIEKCIATNQTEIWFTGGISTEIDRLYNKKWKTLIPKFDDINMQSHILSTIAALQNYCSALDPDNESLSNTSIRKLRIELRNNYVKIHPDRYADIFPYEAFIDDWNNSNEYDM